MGKTHNLWVFIQVADARERVCSDEKLEETLLGLNTSPIRDVISGVDESVDSFTQNTPQSDDITMLILKFIGCR